VTASDAPVPTSAPPHVPEYHFQVDPDDRVPVTEIVAEAPKQIVEGTGVTVVAAAGIGITTTPTLLQFE
jgi:hypothetical protein